MAPAAVGGRAGERWSGWTCVELGAAVRGEREVVARSGCGAVRRAGAGDGGQRGRQGRGASTMGWTATSSTSRGHGGEYHRGNELGHDEVEATGAGSS